MAGKAEINALDKKVTAISKALANLNNQDDFKKLILEWRRPGWTTPAELIFVSAIVDSLGAHVSALVQLKGGLIKGSKAVTGE